MGSEEFDGAVATLLDKADEEIERLSKLLWGARCIYCETILFADRRNQDISDAELRKHIAVCPKHPLPKAIARAEKAEQELEEVHTSLCTECITIRKQTEAAMTELSTSRDESLRRERALVAERDQLREELQELITRSVRWRA